MTETPRDPFAPDDPPPYDDPPAPAPETELGATVTPVPAAAGTGNEPALPEPVEDQPAPPELGAAAAPLPAAAGTENEPPLAEPAQDQPAQPELGAAAAPVPAAAGTENEPAPHDAAPAEPAPQPEHEHPPAEPAPPAPSRSWLPVTAVGLAVLLLAGATGWLGWQVRQQAVAEDGRPDAVAAARDAARLLFSYSHETLEEDFAKGLAVTTGEFRSEYSRTTKEVVTPVAEQYDAVVVAEVVEASLVADGPGRATALVFLNQGTTSTRVQGQQVDQSRVRMQLVERDGRWLVRAVDAL